MNVIVTYFFFIASFMNAFGEVSITKKLKSSSAGFLIKLIDSTSFHHERCSTQRNGSVEQIFTFSQWRKNMFMNTDAASGLPHDSDPGGIPSKFCNVSLYPA